MSSPTRWGILGAGLISHDFVNALTALPEERRNQHKVVAVAARSEDKAKEFAAKFDIPAAYGDYTKLATDPEVDVVYIGSIMPFHCSHTKMFLEAGKPVLCEKSMGMNVKETKEMIRVAKEKNVFLMEAMWSWFQPAHKKLREEIQKGSIGDVVNSQVTFGVVIEAERLFKKELGGGSMLDLGVYTTYFTQLVMGRERPEKIVASGHLNEHGVDLNASAVLTYKNGRTATTSTHAKAELPCVAEVFGTKGSMKLNFPFWCAHELVMPDGKVESFPLGEGKLKFNFHNSAGLAYQAEHVRECLAKGFIESPVVSFEDSTIAAEIMESIRKQVGVTYEQDKE